MGFSDEQIAEAALNVAMFLALTTMAEVYGLGDSGFHLHEMDPEADPEKEKIIEGDVEAWKSEMAVNLEDSGFVGQDEQE